MKNRASSTSLIWNPEVVTFRNGWFFTLKLKCLNVTSALLHLIQFHCFIPQDYPAGDAEDKGREAIKVCKGKRTKYMAGKRKLPKGNSVRSSRAKWMAENERKQKRGLKNWNKRSKKGRLSSASLKKKLKAKLHRNSILHQTLQNSLWFTSVCTTNTIHFSELIVGSV